MRFAPSVGCQSFTESPAMPRNPEIRSVIVDERGRLASDVVCPSCRYNLRGLQQDGACPECGLPVESAILAGNDARWTKLQIVLATLAITFGIVLPIVNVARYVYSFPPSGQPMSVIDHPWPDEVLSWFMLVWLLGGLMWCSALVVAAFNRRFTRKCLLIIVAVLAETVIAVVINAVTWLMLVASI
ncbi:MAG: hypothetical protein IH983_12400 [Planctomycetes bacterium]|nr:hypothetical protein [Planctomycetota bacterium]